MFIFITCISRLDIYHNEEVKRREADASDCDDRSYEQETHIFFDDAIEHNVEDTSGDSTSLTSQPNHFCQTFTDIVSQAAWLGVLTKSFTHLKKYQNYSAQKLLKRNNVIQRVEIDFKNAFFSKVVVMLLRLHVARCLM